MYCTNCGNLPCENAKTCDYCGAAVTRRQAAPPQPPYAPPPYKPRGESTSRMAITVVGVLLGVIALVVAVALVFAALSPSRPGFGAWNPWEYDWDDDRDHWDNWGDWDDWDDWDFDWEPMLAQQLLDDPFDDPYEFRGVSVSGTVTEVVLLDAIYVYGARVFQPKVALHVEDESGMLIVLVWQEDFSPGMMPGSYVQFYGWLRSQYELNGEPVPVIEAWHSIDP